MAATGFELVVDPPPMRKRRSGLLIDAADPISDPTGRWMAGITFTTYGCSSVRRGETLFCGSADEVTAGTVDRSVVTFSSFAVAADEACSSLDIDLAWLNNRLATRFEVGVSKAIAQELMDGANTGSTPSFADAAVLNSGTAVASKMSLPEIEAALADKLDGGEGMIHMSPRAYAVSAINSNFSTGDDGLVRTGSGHIVVTDAGYTGQTPTGGSSTSGAEWIYGSGQVILAVGDPRSLTQDNVGSIDRTRNILSSAAIAQAVFGFDPCAVVAIKTTLAS